jgi:hypothetical protein
MWIVLCGHFTLTGSGEAEQSKWTAPGGPAPRPTDHCETQLVPETHLSTPSQLSKAPNFKLSSVYPVQLPTTPIPPSYQVANKQTPMRNPYSHRSHANHMLPARARWSNTGKLGTGERTVYFDRDLFPLLTSLFVSFLDY